MNNRQMICGECKRTLTVEGDHAEGCPCTGMKLSIDNAIQHTFIDQTANERDRCAALATNVLLTHQGRKTSNAFEKGWNQACWDINHRITNPDAFLTQSPIPDMIQALQAVQRDAAELKNGTITIETLVMVIDALYQLKNPKEL